ncbi:MAG: hypothetical protein O0X93_09705, partial [Methanocorpusculum sp.]|nr:hypothetical protein [Methanocorpusculum sp.]
GILCFFPWNSVWSVFSVVAPSKTTDTEERKWRESSLNQIPNDTSSFLRLSVLFRKRSGILCFFPWNSVGSVFSVVTPSKTTNKKERKRKSSAGLLQKHHL